MTTVEELVLIPTEAEHRLCAELLDSLNQSTHICVHLCGWGVIQSAVGATKLVMELKPQRVWLIGIAGALPISHPVEPFSNADTSGESANAVQVGDAYEFTRIAIDGIGVGQGTHHISFESLGWQKLFGGPAFPCGVITLCPEAKMHLDLLTVCSASVDHQEAELRRKRYPLALAEDMESYAVAAACIHLNVPARVVRGISNQAGDREYARWQSQRAMRSAIELVCRLMSEN